jgi:hypothetical protein
MIRTIKRLLARRALERTMRPDPEHRTLRLSQFNRARQMRYWQNVFDSGVNVALAERELERLRKGGQGAEALANGDATPALFNDRRR